MSQLMSHQAVGERRDEIDASTRQDVGRLFSDPLF